MFEIATTARDHSPMLGPVPEAARCLRCGYALRDLPGSVCPECGRAFDPSNPKTFRPGPGPPWSRRWAHPPGAGHMLPVGLYWVDRVVVDVTAPCVHVFTDPGVLDAIGFASCPSGPRTGEVDVGLPAGWYVHEE